MPGPFDHPQRAAFAAHSWLIPRLLSRFKDPLVARQGHTGWTTRSAGRVWNGRFLAQGRRPASSLRTPRGLTTPARIRSIPLCGNVYAAGIRMPLHRFAGTIRRNKHRDDRAHGRLQNPLAQNDVRDGEPSRRWEARWNKWKGQGCFGAIRGWREGSGQASFRRPRPFRPSKHEGDSGRIDLSARADQDLVDHRDRAVAPDPEQEDLARGGDPARERRDVYLMGNQDNGFRGRQAEQELPEFGGLRAGPVSVPEERVQRGQGPRPYRGRGIGPCRGSGTIGW